MKKFLSFFFIVSLMACSNDLNLTADYENIPIIYALISPEEPAQYFRVEKAFIDPEVSPLALAQIADSLYYDNVSVNLVRVSTGESIDFQAVDGNEEGIIRDEGVFATAPNILYKALSSQLSLIGDEEYQLNIDRGDGSPIITASTVLVEAPLIASPNEFSALNIVPDKTFEVRWLKSESSFIYDLKMVFNYFEKDLSIPNSNFEEKSLIWDITTGVTNPQSGEILEVSTEGADFHGFLLSQLEVDENLDRRFSTADVVLLVGGEELFNFQSVASANLGITASQDIPNYTNLSEGRGIFSSRISVSREDLEFTAATRDSIIEGSSTKFLNFNN